MIAGGTAFALQAAETDERMDNSLSRAVAALRSVEAEGRPGTKPAVQQRERRAQAGRARPGARQERGRRRAARRRAGVAAGPGDPVGPARGGARARGRARRDERRHPVRAADRDHVGHAVPLDRRPGPAGRGPRHGLFVVAFDRSAEMSSLRSTFLTYSAVGLGALAVIAVVAWFVVGRLLRPIRLLRDTTRRITESDLSERITVTGKDDLSNLARTVNAMLDRLERAFGSQRELLDDVGHELRTPLTIVRGHLELLDADDPDDVRATQALALDELDRMQRLVDDLMTLATADRPDFVRLAPADVGRLTDDVHDKARASATGAGWSRRGRTWTCCWTPSGSPRRGCSSWRTRTGTPPPAPRCALGSEVVGRPAAPVGARQGARRPGRRGRPDLRTVPPRAGRPHLARRRTRAADRRRDRARPPRTRVRGASTG